KGGFSQAGRAVEENMIESFASAAGCLNGDRNVFLDALLTDVFIKAFWADAGFDPGVFVKRCAGDDSVLFSSVDHSFCARVGHCSGFRVNSVRPLAGPTVGTYIGAVGLVSMRRHEMFALWVRREIAALRAAISRNSLCPLRVWLHPRRIPQLEVHSRDSPARRQRRPQRQRAMLLQVSRLATPQLRACLSARPPCAPRSCGPLREFS